VERQRGVIAAVRAPGAVKLARQRLACLGVPRERAQDVEADDIARALPDAVQRRLAVEKRQGRVLDIAHAAQGLHRLDHDAGAETVRQVLGQRHGEAGEAAFGGRVEGAGGAEAERGRALPVEDEVGEDRAHQRLVDQAVLEGAAVARPVMRLGQGRAHQTRGRHGRVEPGVVHHLDQRADAVALGAEAVGDGAFVLDLCRGVRAVAELVLEALEADRVASFLEPAGHEEAGEARRRAREREEGIGHGRRAEPLVPGKAPVAVGGLGPGGGGAQVRSALLFRHRHAEGGATLFGHGEHARIVAARQELRAPEVLEARVGAQRGDGGIGHRHGAAGAGVHLRRHVDHGGVGRVAAAPRPPRQSPRSHGRGPRPADRGRRVHVHLVEPPPAASWLRSSGGWRLARRPASRMSARP
jgi:hypothetical protein